MHAFFADGAEIRTANEQFESWLNNTLLNDNSSREEIRRRLIDWQSAPGAQFCHPREEHLMPLHVCFGIAGKSADLNNKIEILNKQASNFIWLSA